MLPSLGGLKRLYLRHFAKPAHDQTLHRFVHQHCVVKLAQLGIGNLERTLRLIEVAAADNGGAPFELVGFDKFESRASTDVAGLSLKDAHKLLSSKGIKHRLWPGDPTLTLAATANNVSGVDLLLVSADQNASTLERAWFYVPRMLSPAGIVFIEERQPQADEFIWRALSAAELTQRAARPRPRRAA